ncbi:hypothetical protein V2H45_18400 [Tumidithrix elongata RA019]|uniref:Uncharacterized protein n=1 Tax=Tumidithrix elongata BACA0141 TaxID=2716417 RepID=A0AAW9PUR5_9CYAN|nr:hypothetical protein [Tumidithrix elongata RA019]
MLRSVITKELIRRHGCGAMTDKIKPVHIANGLFRETLGAVAKTRDLREVLIYTAAQSTEDMRDQAMSKLLERSKDRWGRLAEDALSKEGALGKQVLPMLRTLLGTDGAVFGKSIDQSSLTSPTGSLITSDPSDEHAGALIKNLWGFLHNEGESPLLSLLREKIDPERDLGSADDLTVLFAPLNEGMRDRKANETVTQCEDFQKFQQRGNEYDPVINQLRQAADLLYIYEKEVRPNPIATLERIVCLGSLSVFFYLSTRGQIWANLPKRPLLIQVSGNAISPIARASEESVQQLTVRDVKRYMVSLLESLLMKISPDSDEWLELWETGEIWDKFTELTGVERKSKDDSEIKELTRIIVQRDSETEIEEILAEIVDKLNEKASLVDYLRLLGLRSGLLYPQQKNPKKRVCPEDRVIEVLVAGTINVVNEVVEYQEFLERLWERFRIVTGGHPEDEFLLTQAGIPRVSSKHLRQNSEAFLKRLEEQGLAKRMADSKALVGLVEAD